MSDEAEKQPASLRDHCKAIAAAGGRSRSERKRAAARENLRRAVEARRLRRHYPDGPVPPADNL